MRELARGRWDAAATGADQREAHGVDANHSFTVGTHSIDEINLPNHGLDRTPREFVAKNENADFSIRRPVRVDRIDDSVDELDRDIVNS